MNQLLRLCSILILTLTLISCAAFRSTSSNSPRDSQEQTIESIRDIAIAIESYKLVNSKYPPGEVAGSIKSLEAILVPSFLKSVPQQDGWGNALQYYCNQPEGPYYIVSLGSDSQADVDIYNTEGTPVRAGFSKTSNVTDDIIFSNGVFVRYPEFLEAEEIDEKVREKSKDKAEEYGEDDTR